MKYLWALRKVNNALIDGLKAAIYILENDEDISKERKKSMAETLKGLVAQSEEIYGETETSH